MLSPAEQLRALGISLEQMQAEAPLEHEGRLKFTDVPDGPELHRVISLNRRPAPDHEGPEAAELAAFLTERLATVEKPYPGPLRPTQALALKEAWENNGLVAPIRVGGGKSLISFLIPVVLGAKDPLYLCPALMVKDIQAEFEKFRKSWRSPARYPVLSYSKLANPRAGGELSPQGEVVRKPLLERLAPDLIVLDEAHCCASSGAVTTKRIKAYLKANPETRVVVMSGTLFKTSIKDAAHLMEWALGKKAPLPQDFLEREAWASHLDAQGAGGPRADAGALLRFLSSKERDLYATCQFDEDRRGIVRSAVARRILETPGVLGTQDPPLDIGLTIEAFTPSRQDDAIEEAFVALRKTWCLPDGTELADALSLGRHAYTLGLGYWSRWDPAPPDEWREARNTWSVWCRNALKYNRMGIDSEARMKDAVRKGIYNDRGALENWEAAMLAERERTGLLEPPSVPVWVSDEAIDAIRDWIRDHDGLIWVNSIPLGTKAEELLGIPYYGAKGLDGRGRYILEHRGGPAVVSMMANGTGKNLQKLWHKNLWMCAPNEQSLGRTHRAGQTADTVENWIYIGCAEHLRSFWAAQDRKARFANEMLASLQKLRYAKITLPTLEELSTSEGERWQSKTEIA